MPAVAVRFSGHVASLALVVVASAMAGRAAVHYAGASIASP